MADKTPSVLIVDDEQGFRDLFTYMLEPLGIKVACACSGMEALEKIKDNSYDLILIDVHMPEMTGIETIQKVRLVRPGQKFVILSSASDLEREQEKKLEKDGMIECLFKPVELDDLKKVLKKTLGIHLDGPEK